MPPRGRSFRGRGISQAQRRKKTWVQLEVLVGAGTASPGRTGALGLDVTTPSVNGTTNRDGFIAMTGDGSGAAPFASLLPDESTILRIRGSLVFPKNGASTVGFDPLETQFVFGVGVTGISDLNSDSYPGPISDADWDGWMFLRQSALGPADSNATLVDIKAMRKIQSGDALFVMAEGAANLNAGQSISGSWQFDLRVLLLLP